MIIQTYNPNHYAIQCATNHDYEGFFQQEMQYRQKVQYPPYCHLVSIIVQSKNEALVHQAAKDIQKYVVLHIHHAKILGPAKSIIYKMQDIYRERILIKFVQIQDVYQAILEVNDYYNKKQKGKVNVVCDFNPYSQI